MFVLLNVRAPKEPDLFGTELPLEKYTDEDVQPIEPFAALPRPIVTKDGAALYEMGAPGVSQPNCKINKNPSYTDEAREAKVRGAIVFDAVVRTDGTLEEARILRGLPGGLNERALSVVRGWHCNPGLKNGKPVNVLVTFEVNFRLN